MTGIIVTPTFIMADGLTLNSDRVDSTTCAKLGTLELFESPFIYALAGDVCSALTALQLLREVKPSSFVEAAAIKYPTDDYRLILVPNMQHPDNGFIVTQSGFEILPLRDRELFFGSAAEWLAGAYSVSRDLGATVKAASEHRVDFGGMVQVKRLGVHGTYCACSTDLTRTAKDINEYMAGY